MHTRESSTRVSSGSIFCFCRTSVSLFSTGRDWTAARAQTRANCLLDVSQLDTMCDVVQTRGSSTRVSGGSNFCFCRSSVLLFLTTMMGRQRKHEQGQNAFLMCHTWRQSVLSVQDLSNLFCLASAYGPKLLSDKIVLNFVATSPVKY